MERDARRAIRSGTSKSEWGLVAPAKFDTDALILSAATGRSKWLRLGDLVSKIVIDEGRVFNFGEFMDGKPKQKVPKAFANHIEELADFEGRCSSTCHQIFRLLAMGLEVRAFLSFDRYLFRR
jgi:hypothetical protein